MRATDKLRAVEAQERQQLQQELQSLPGVSPIPLADANLSMLTAAGPAEQPVIAELEALFEKAPGKDEFKPSEKALQTWNSLGPLEVRAMVEKEQLALGTDLTLTLR